MNFIIICIFIENYSEKTILFNLILKCPQVKQGQMGIGHRKPQRGPLRFEEAERVLGGGVTSSTWVSSASSSQQASANSQSLLRAL